MLKGNVGYLRLKSMRSTTSKTIIFLSTLIIAVLVAAQLMWLFKIYQYEQKEFRTSVIKSMRGVYEEIELLEASTIRLQKLVEQTGPKIFLMKINCTPGKDSLVNAMVHNLEDFGVFTDCNLLVYDGVRKKILYEAYLPSVGSEASKFYGEKLPDREYSYIMLHFPHITRYIVNAMRWWIFSMVLILAVLIAFSFSMYYLYRQKFINEIQHDFIRNVTHEFQTPLTTLSVGLDALSKPSLAGQPEKKDKYIHLMQGQLSYLKYHIENLMKVLKAESQGVEVNKQTVSPIDLINKAIHQLSYSIEEKSAVIRFNPEHHFTINADPSGLYVAILNLLLNAIKYSPHPEIDISCYQQNNTCLISIRDNGVGIEERHIKNLFKKFYRVTEGDVHEVKGLGLGLYFAKKVIDGHNGHIRVNSKPGEGTEFIIEIPV